MPPVSPMMQVPHWVQIFVEEAGAVSLPIKSVSRAGMTILRSWRAMVCTPKAQVMTSRASACLMCCRGR
jgi:hypothetical protein